MERLMALMKTNLTHLTRFALQFLAVLLCFYKFTPTVGMLTDAYKMYKYKYILICRLLVSYAFLLSFLYFLLQYCTHTNRQAETSSIK